MHLNRMLSNPDISSFQFFSSLSIITLLLSIIIINQIHAKELYSIHKQTLSEIKNSSLGLYPHNAVKDSPHVIGLGSVTNILYVANAEDDTVSVINGKNNTKTGDDIKVGNWPSTVGVISDTDTMDTANSRDNFVFINDAVGINAPSKICFYADPF